MCESCPSWIFWRGCIAPRFTLPANPLSYKKKIRRKDQTSTIPDSSATKLFCPLTPLFAECRLSDTTSQQENTNWTLSGVRVAALQPAVVDSSYWSKPPSTHISQLVKSRHVKSGGETDGLHIATVCSWFRHKFFRFLGSGPLPAGLLITVRSWRTHGDHEPDSVHHEVKLGELLGQQVRAATKASLFPAPRMPCCTSTKKVLKMRPFRLEPGPIESVAPFQSRDTTTFTYPSLHEDCGIGGCCSDRCMECE